MQNSIRVGKSNCRRPGYKLIMCTTQSSTWAALSPYVARRENGEIMENSWQFRKVYPSVPKVRERYSRWDKTIIWDWPAEDHVDQEGRVTEEYIKWRQAGLNNQYPVRYPAGRSNRHNCLGFLDDNGVVHDYISSRGKYLEYYIESINSEQGKDTRGRTSSQRLNDLRKAYERNNLLICEPDGPSEDPDHYAEIGVSVENGTILITRESITRLYYDTKYPFGHGYCLAGYLMGLFDVV